MGEADSEVCGAVLSEGLMEFEKPKVAPLVCEDKNVVGGSEPELYSKNKADDLLAHIDIKGFMHNETCERPKNNALESLAEGKGNGDPNCHGLEHCSTNEVKEVSNDDMFSEVSNPNLSPWDHSSSFQTISSSLVECTINTQAVCAEITSSCSGREESLDMEDPSSNEASGRVTATRIVLEIPNEFNTTGVRKITFKFRESNDKSQHSALTTSPFTKGDLFVFNNQSVWNPIEPSGVDVEFNSNTTKELYQTGNPCLHPPNMGLKITKKVVPDIYPTNVKKLLSTKLLEGAHVKYISTSGQKQLSGIVKDPGYLCGCSFCNFSKVLSAYEFELHAGGKTRHPNNHIYLENGKPIYSIIHELKTTPLELIDQMLKDVAGSSVNERNLKTWKGMLLQSHDGVESNYFYHGNSPGIFHSTTSQWTKDCISAQNSCTDEYFLNQHAIMDMPEEQKHVRKKARSFTGSVTEQKKTSEGGPKKRDNDLHRLLFMPNGLPDGTDLGYYSKGKKILGGYKHGNGILCSCCNTEISPSQFEAHAGWAAKRQPYRHIFTSNGLTLHDIALMLASGQSVATDSSNDMCSVCGDRGELIMCDGCPQAFHAACLCVVGVDYAPSSNWLCPHCQHRPGRNGRNTNAESRPIIIRLTRVVKAPSYESGGCVVCRIPDFSPETFDDRTVMLCDQCEKEYHVGCLRKIGLCDLKELPTEKWFCCCECNTIYLALQNCVMKGSEVVNPSVSATITKKHLERGLSDGDTNDIQWRILSGKSRYAEHLPLLSRAAAIFRECFDPIVAKTGRDLIPVMVYGRNISGQEFGGMYCVVLLIKSVVVSAGLLRVFGQEVAELPLVATSREYQGKGYFQALFACIEMLLHSMHVKNLVLPAAEEAESIWTKKLGFKKMTDERYLRYSRDLQLTVFKGTSMLEKEVQQTCI